jgi:hypothetical protein
MTFCATCVVVRMVVTHFLKPVVGIASGTRAWIGSRGELVSRICLSVVELSNQKRQVTWTELVGEGDYLTVKLTSAAN